MGTSRWRIGRPLLATPASLLGRVESSRHAGRDLAPIVLEGHRRGGGRGRRRRGRTGAGRPARRRTGLGRPPDALGAADAGRGRPGPVRPAVLARLLPPHPQRRRVPQRRRLRRLLPHEGPAPPPQPLPRRPRPVRRAGQGLPEARHGRARADRPARRPTTTSARRTPTGSPSTPRGSRAATGPRPRCG